MKNISNAWCGGGEDTAALCARLFPGAVQRYTEQADLVCENSFVFRDHWEMERATEPVTFEKDIGWHFKPGSDPEWTYAFNRHSFVLNLAKAYALTRNDRYALTASRLILDWINSVPLNENTKLTAWRAIEAGIRSENWLKSMQLIGGCASLPAELRTKADESLRVHAEYLTAAHTDFQRLSNWGVLQDRGLFLLGVYFQEAAYIDLSLERLNDNLRLQILPDGIHWEQSPQYHAEVLKCLLTVVQTARRCGIALPEGFADTARHMARALALWVKPDGHLPLQSDSDDIDARDVFVRAAVIFDDMDFKAFVCGELFEENIWELGADACNAYSARTAPVKKAESAAFSHSGNYVLRSGGNYLRMRCGSLGGGHGHADLLHIDLFAYGEDILTDSGRYNYRDIPIRRMLKSPAAHNTVVMDGKDFTEYKGAWEYSPIAVPVKGEYRFTEKADYVSGGHLGYIREGVAVFRKIVYIKPDIYVIFDELYSVGRHRFTQYFHWSNRGGVSMEGGLVRYNGKSAQAVLIPLTQYAEMTLTETNMSRAYNELERAKCLQVNCRADDFAGLVTVIAVKPAGEELAVTAELIPAALTKTGEVLPDGTAQAVRILYEGGEYTVILLHSEVFNIIEAGGNTGYGKALVFTPDNKPNGVCLAW